MFSVPDGRAANHPPAVTIFRPPIAAPLPGARVSLAVMASPASVSSLIGAGDSWPSRAELLVVHRAELRRQLPIVLARVLARARGDLGGQQIHDRAVLVGRPDG